MFLEEITNEAGLENDRLECKSILNREDIVGWLKTISGFANANGGILYIGVEDKTNKLIGFDRIAADNERNYFNNQVNEHITPRPQMDISFIPYNIKENERYVIRVDIKESIIKPVILKYKSIPSIFIRRNGFTNGATYEEIIQMSIKSSKTQYDVLPSGEKYDRNKIQVLCNYYAEQNKGRELSDKALRSMGFICEDGDLANGAVLFTDDYNGQKTAVQCSVFSGFHKGSERIVSLNKYNGNIISSIGYMLEYIKQRMNHTVIKLGETRRNIDAYPQRALFEGIINAVVHRDYYLDGTQIQIDMFKDRLEISSPGGFFGGDKFGKTYDLSGIISKRRNELISDVLVACNAMEAAGTGFDKIMDEYSDVDEKHRPYIFSSSDHFTLVLPDLTYSEGINDSDSPNVIYPPVPEGTDLDARVLSFCFSKARKVSEIAAHLGISDSSYLRNNVLKNLEKNGYLEAGKVSRAVYYKTNRDIVRAE